MSRTLLWPMRIGPDGTMMSVAQGTAAEATQIIAAIVLTEHGERPLAPQFGLHDPIGRTVTEAELVSVIELCEPDLQVISVAPEPTVAGRLHTRVEAAWR